MTNRMRWAQIKVHPVKEGGFLLIKQGTHESEGKLSIIKG